jgi:hypothetical protein
MLLSIVIIVFIISIFLKLQFDLDLKNTLLLFFLFFLLIIIPSTRTIRHIYFQFKIIAIIIISLTIILLSPLDIKIKIILSSILIIIYYKNISIVSNIVIQACKAIKSKDDYPLKEKIYNFYNNIGIRIISNFDKLPNHPTLLIGNYCRDRIEHPLCILFPRKYTILAGKNFKNINLHNIADKIIYLKNKNSYEFLKKEIKTVIEEGYDVFVYINSTNQSYFDYINKLRSGIFKIALECEISITPVTFGFIDTYFGTIPSQNLNIKVGDTFKIKSVYEGKYKVRKFFNESLKEFEKTKYLL